MLWNERKIFNHSSKIDASIDEFGAFPPVEGVFGVGRVMEQELVVISEEIKIFKLVKVDRVWRSGSYIHARVSLNGTLCLYMRSDNDNGSSCSNHQMNSGRNDNNNDNKHTLQFINTSTNKGVIINVEESSSVAFYNEKAILLTFRKYPRESNVEDLFQARNLSTFKNVGDVKVDPHTDTSVTHSTRWLYYNSVDGVLYKYNVDTKENVQLDIGHQVWSSASLLGVDVGVRCIFRDRKDRCTYALDEDSSVAKLCKKEGNRVKSFFAHSSDPYSLESGMTVYERCLRKNDVKHPLGKQLNFGCDDSIVRLYKDVFMFYDYRQSQWVVSRVVVC